MRRGGKLLLFLGLILAVIAFAGVWYIMRTAQQPEEPAEVFTQTVVVAATDIPARTRISPEYVTLKEMPLDLVPPLAVTEILSATDRIILTDVFADQVILHSMLAEEGMGYGLVPALDVPPGMVAMAVPINEISGVAEALRTGDLVDVIVSLRISEYDQEGNESMPEYSAQFTIQDVEILHIGSWAPPMPETATEEGAGGGALGAGGGRAGGTTCEPLNVVILLVEPQDALVLKYALDTKEEEGREAFTMVLRGIEDHERYTTEAVTQDYMAQRFKFSRPPLIIREGQR